MEVTTLAGSGMRTWMDGRGGVAAFNNPGGVAIHPFGNIVVADLLNFRIRSVTQSGVVSTLAGTGQPASVDGRSWSASFFFPIGVGVDRFGNVYVSEREGNRIRKIGNNDVVTTLAGSGNGEYADGMGTAASFNGPASIAIDGSDNLVIADQVNHRIRKVTPAGEVTTLAGSGSAGWVDGQGIAASFNQPWGVAVDTSGNTYVGDVLNHRIRKVTSSGLVTTLAGSGSPAWVDGQGAAASFDIPNGVAVDRDGNVYVADNNNHRIRKVTADGTVTTLAGSVDGDVDGIGAAAQFSHPAGITIDAMRNLYVSETAGSRLRKLSEVGRGQLVVSWTASNDAYASYTARASGAGPTGGCETTGTSCIMNNLASGVPYTIVVITTSVTGTSVPSAAVVATPN
jgi:sugar lactone lactonase YvrE